MPYRDPEKRREKTRARRAANPEKYREQNRAYYVANPERREQDRANHAANPEKRREQDRANHAANPEKARERSRAWRAANPEKARENQLRHKYKISRAQWDAIATAQGGLCGICGKPLGAKVHTDHCHTSGQVRGLLCIRCNTMLGHIERPGLLTAAQAYLAAPPAFVVLAPAPAPLDYFAHVRRKKAA